MEIDGRLACPIQEGGGHDPARQVRDDVVALPVAGDFGQWIAPASKAKRQRCKALLAELQCTAAIGVIGFAEEKQRVSGLCHPGSLTWLNPCQALIVSLPRGSPCHLSVTARGEKNALLSLSSAFWTTSPGMTSWKYTRAGCVRPRRRLPRREYSPPAWRGCWIRNCAPSPRRGRATLRSRDLSCLRRRARERAFPAD